MSKEARMSCGACGCQDFSIYKLRDIMLVECKQCKSTSTLGVSEPKIVIGWGYKSNGILCVMESQE